MRVVTLSVPRQSRLEILFWLRLRFLLRCTHDGGRRIRWRRRRLRRIGRPDQTVVLTGGSVRPSNALVGPVAVGALRHLHVDLLFMGVHGMDHAGGSPRPTSWRPTPTAPSWRPRAGSSSSPTTPSGESSASARSLPLDEADVLITDDRLATDARDVLAEQVGELSSPAGRADGGSHRLMHRWRAPGRVNLIGEHTDYNDGFVLPLRARPAVRRRGRSTAATTGGCGCVRRSRATPVEVAGRHRPGRGRDGLGRVRRRGGLGAARGRARRRRRLRRRVDGDVPAGAGLSSSAALECAVAAALDELGGLGAVPATTWPRLAQRAENDFVGAPDRGDGPDAPRCSAAPGTRCSSTAGRSTTEQVPFDLAAAGLALLVIDTRAPHAHVDGEYADRRRGPASEAARLLGVPALRDVTVDDLDAALARLADDGRPARRARHVVTENARVLATVAAAAGRPTRATIGPLLTASHASMRDDFEITVPEVDLAVEAALAAGAFGARMTGGGFGGCVLALVEADRRPAASARRSRRAFAPLASRPPVPFVVTAAAGAHTAVTSRLRLPWTALPARVHDAVADILGSRVVEAVSQSGGFSPGSADRVRTVAGTRAFVKAVSPAQNPMSPAVYRREIVVSRGLPSSASAPALLGSYDDGEWVALVLADVAGRHPVTPWQFDEVTAVLRMLARLAAGGIQARPTCSRWPSTWPRTCAAGSSCATAAFDPWAFAHANVLVDLAEQGVAALTPDTLVHADTRADNLLIDASGRVFLVDWPWACLGPVWLDSLALLVNVNLYGGLNVEAILTSTPLLAAARPEDQTGFLAGLASFSLNEARKPPRQAGLPTLRAFQRAQGDATLGWLERRLG